MHHCMKYRLNEDGSVPNFLCLDPNGVGGVYGVSSPGTSRHNDTIFIGLSNNDASGNFEILATQQDLEDYLRSVSADWSIPDPNDPSNMIPFDPVAAAAWVWERKANLDARV